MTFAELLAEVYIATNRPDLVTQTKQAIKAATLKAHSSDYYSRDIFETGVEFPTSHYVQSLESYSLVTNFRSLKYLRRVTDENDQSGTFFEIVTPEEVLDSYNRNRTDIAYQAGRVLEIRSSVPFQYCLMGAYALPIITEENYASWIAELVPYAIIYEAARVIFAQVGYMEQASAMSRLVAEEYAALKITGLTDVGY